jgi:phosphoribosylformylglycinamidine cyclo-ligase
MGVGMVAVLPADDVDRALAVLTARHVPSWVLGSVRRVAEPTAPDAPPGSRVQLRGDHPRF